MNMNIGVAYKTDMEHAFEVLNRIGKEMAEEEEWGPVFLDPIKALRIDNFGDSAIEIKVLGEVLPIRQWEVSGEYRLRVKKAFAEEGIEIPFPSSNPLHGRCLPGNHRPAGRNHGSPTRHIPCGSSGKQCPGLVAHIPEGRAQNQAHGRAAQ